MGCAIKVPDCTLLSAVIINAGNAGLQQRKFPIGVRLMDVNEHYAIMVLTLAYHLSKATLADDLLC